MRLVRSFGGFIATIVGFAYLSILSLFIVYLVVAALGALQVSEAISSGDGNETVASVQQAMQRVEAQRAVIFEELRRKDVVGNLNAQLLTPYDTIVSHLSRTSPAAAGWSYDFETFDLAGVPGIAEFREDCAAPVTTIPECAQLARYDTLVSQRDRLIAEGAGEQFRVEEQRALERIAQMEEEHALAEHFPTLRFFAKDPVFEALLTMPTQISVLILTIVMGALGSIISMTWSFVRQDSNATIRRFLVMPLVGCTSAFIVYVFLKAGQMTITSDSGSATLSPFFVSFVGIVSGLVAERAYTRVADIGTGFFAASQEQPRWGIGLASAAAEAELDASAVAAHLGLTLKEVEAYLAEEAPVPADRQRLLAACLRRSMRDLFTDVPPEAPPSAPRREAPAAEAPPQPAPAAADGAAAANGSGRSAPANGAAGTAERDEAA